MRNTFSEALYQAASANPDVYIVVADISPVGSMEKFSKQYPERFINVGVAEQSMIGICAGLALKGCQPFAYTIATFALYRPFEMVRDDLCYQNLPVTVVGMGAGIIYSTLGGTHHTQEDIAIAGAIPNMQIIAPCDPAECTQATRYCAAQKKGPIYLRIGKAGEPNYTDKAVDPWVFGKLRRLRRGSDVAILTYGVIAGMAQAWWPRKAGTRLLRGTSILGTALPVFWFAIILQLVFAARLNWFPIEGRLGADTLPPPHLTGFYTVDALLSGQWSAFGDAVIHLVLPVLSLVAWMFALTSRVAERSFATELTRPYVQTAVARGVSSSRLLWRHVLRNALNPIITMLGLQFGWLLAGTILVEVVFSWGGLGSVMYTALQNFDYPMIEAITLVITVAFVVVNLVVDLLYPVVDPRIRRQ